MSEQQVTRRILPLNVQLERRLSKQIFHRLIEIVMFLLLTVTIIIFGWGIKRSQSLHKQTSADLQKVIQDYGELLQFASDFNSGNLTNLSTTFQHYVLEKYSHIVTKQEVKADLFFLDETGRPYLSNLMDLSEDEATTLARQWQLIKPTNIKPNSLVIAVSRGIEPALWLAYADNTSQCKALLKIRANNFAKSLAAEPMYNLLVHEDYWALAPNGSHILDAISQLPEALRNKQGFYFANKQLYYVVNSALFTDELYLYTVWNVSLIVMLLLVIALTSLILFSLLYALSKKNSRLLAAEFTRDIAHVQTAFNEAEQGNLDYKLAIDSSLEMQAIGKGYQAMMQSLKRQMQENAELERIVADEQIKQLGSQFTNHFLFNTLDNIYYMCRLSPDLAEKMVMNLAKLLRYNTHSPNEKVTIGEDLQYIRLYLEIVKIRFRDSFKYEIAMDESVEDYVLPKLLIQPIIENALKYGRQSQAVTILEIKVKQVGPNIEIACHDNGPGMSETVLKRLKNNLQKEENLTTHLGLYNVARRIALTYGEKYGLDLKNTAGLTVTVTIPAEKELD
ncbi:sensor histidine kinase [Amygdalobacter nucleatus]|uniref:ATPase/histidine kinase/DNA gyrase B/HSP90 domain protein n=1 Tax=Amygdalobacter nucleatus TaxID=3029274 RepID=A0A133YC81_9FIRM|nr:histidine kinase [Amygdalobacter nucleatus]KXB40790.1 ATPase/histidine kinase/DNA gyrase B/HSP90 domain protein [Amygdalobacter nucleatus]MDF0485155.1 histidine kinase [Amygdalobacter nucleatus]